MKHRWIWIFLSVINTVYCVDREMTLIIEAGKRECFFELAKKDQTIDIEYQVIDGGHGDLDISFDLSESNGRVIFADYKKPDNIHRHLVPLDGEFKFCFDNSFSSFNREKPNDVEWNELAQMKVPLLLNYAQCMLLLKNYYKAIECCTEVLKYDPINKKAYFRRAKAHVGAWNSTDAEKDFNKCIELDPGLKSAVIKELAVLQEKLKQQDEKSKSNFRKLF